MSKDDTHTYYRCGQTAYVPCDGGRLELRRCAHVCRKEYIATHMKGLHTYPIPQDRDTGFPRNALDREQTKLQSRLRSVIIEKLARLILETGISINRATREGMRNFIFDMIRLGMAFSTKSVNIEETIGEFSRRVLTEKILQLGVTMKERDIQNARDAHFVNIIVDAGSVLGKKVIHSMFTNPYDENFPITVEVSENSGMNKIKYKEFFQLLLYRCQKQELTVCSIITDGLRAQKSAILELIRESEDPNVQAVIYLHCLAHLTQLAFRDSVRQSGRLQRLVSEVNEFANSLRKPAAATELGEKCPCMCQTRWLYLVDVLMWIFKREEKLQAFLLASENNTSGRHTLPEDWKAVLLILWPLKRLNLLMEASSCALWELIPIIEKVLLAWRRLLPHLLDRHLEIMKVVVSSLFVRLRQASPAVVVAAYSLSELGRAVLRRKEQGFQTRGSEQECFISDSIRSMDTCIEELENERAPWVHSTEENDLSNDGRVVTDNHDTLEQQTVEEEEDETDTDNNDAAREEMLRLSIVDLLGVSVYDYTHEAAFTEIARVGTILGISQEYMHECFCQWLYSDRSTTPTKYDITSSPNTIWRRVPVVNSRWRDFARLALRFVTVSTSEADCERSLSLQKDIQGLHTCNITTDLLEARMRACQQ